MNTTLNLQNKPSNVGSSIRLMTTSLRAESYLNDACTYNTYFYPPTDITYCGQMQSKHKEKDEKVYKAITLRALNYLRKTKTGKKG